MSQFSCLIEIFEQKKQLENFYKNCLIITEDKQSPLKNIAIENHCKILSHDKDIGGRYSIFSNIGIVPAILAGINVTKIYEGAKDILLNISNEKHYDYYQKFANFFSSHEILKIFNMNVLMTYSDSFFYFGKCICLVIRETVFFSN